VDRRTVLGLCLSGVLAVAAGGGAWAACVRWSPLALWAHPDRALPGLRIDGERVGERAVREFAAARVRALEGRRVRLRANGEEVLQTTLGELGVSVDVEAVTSRALRVGRAQGWLDRAVLAERARRGNIDVPLEPRIDGRAVVERLLPFKEDLDLPPAAARMDVEHHTIVPERDGRALDIDASAAAIARAAVDPGTTSIDLAFARIAPRVTRASLERADVSRVLASFSTYFSRRGDQGPRAGNIETAAARIDGLVIEAGQTISFNDVVGARSEGNGFRKSWEIFKGEYVEGTGGGTCQVASTLHAIAFFGGLDILQRLPHSRPSVYIQAGLDATVVYPTVDLKLRNPYAFPLVIHAKVADNKITMDLLGAEKPVQVTFGHEVLSTTPFGRKVVEEATVRNPKRKQKGMDGVELSRWRVLAFHDGHTRVERSRDSYPPTTEIWQVPPGYDESQLPPLGEDFPKADAKPEASLVPGPSGGG
jgi:vancomycin resistance protein YoaR